MEENGTRIKQFGQELKKQCKIAVMVVTMIQNWKKTVRSMFGVVRTLVATMENLSLAICSIVMTMIATMRHIFTNPVFSNAVWSRLQKLIVMTT